MNRNPPWKPPDIRPAAVGSKVSGPPTPANPRDSSELGAPGEVDTAVPEARSSDSAGAKVTVVAVVSNAVIVRF